MRRLPSNEQAGDAQGVQVERRADPVNALGGPASGAREVVGAGTNAGDVAALLAAPFLAALRARPNAAPPTRSNPMGPGDSGRKRSRADQEPRQMPGLEGRPPPAGAVSRPAFNSVATTGSHESRPSGSPGVSLAEAARRAAVLLAPAFAGAPAGWPSGMPWLSATPRLSWIARISRVPRLSQTPRISGLSGICRILRNRVVVAVLACVVAFPSTPAAAQDTAVAAAPPSTAPSSTPLPSTAPSSTQPSASPPSATPPSSTLSPATPPPAPNAPPALPPPAEAARAAFPALLARAHALRLADDPHWLRLGHWRRVPG